MGKQYSSVVKFLKILLVVSVIISLGFFVNATDFQKSIHSIQLIGNNFWVPMAISFSAYLSATVGWRYCLGRQGTSIPLVQLFVIRHIGETVSLVNPLGIIGGEAVKTALLKNKGIEKKKAIASIVISRVLMAISQILLCTIVTLSLVLDSTHVEIVSKNAVAFLVLIFALFLLGYICFHPNLRKIDPAVNARLSNSRVRYWLNNFWLKWKSVQTEIVWFSKNNKKAAGWAITYFLLHWLIGSLEFFYLLKFLGFPITFQQSIFMDMGVVLFKSAGAFIPAQFGIEEYGNKIMLSLVGVAGIDIWITVSILRRMRQLLWVGIGLAFYLLIQIQRKTVSTAM